MADESGTSGIGPIRLNDQNATENSAEQNKKLMDTIRNYRAIYDKSYPEYKNQRVKSNAWQAVSRSLGMDVTVVQKRYNTIRSNFSKYLKDLKGKSGCGRGDVQIRPDLEYLRWLISHIKHRQTSSNIPPFQPELLSSVAAVDMTGFDCDESILDTDDDILSGELLSASDSRENSIGSPNGSVVSVASSADSQKGQDIQNLNKRKLGKSDEIPDKRPWAKSRGFENEVVKTMQGISASLVHLTTPENEQRGQAKGNANEDEDSLFCQSLVPKFKRIPTSLKSTLQLNILKTINDMELYVQQHMQKENTARQIPSQQSSNVGFQNQWFQYHNTDQQHIDS